MEQAEGDADMAREVAQSMLGDKMTFYVDGKPIEAEVVQTEDVDGVVVQTSERVNGHLINQYTREELDALTAPPQQANDNADVARPHPVDEIRQPQEGQKPNEENNAVDEASTASKIPQDESGEYDYMQAEPSKAWDALLEQTEGDADMAREVAQSMLEDKVAELEEAQKQQPKEGKSVAEKIAARKEHKADIERIEKEIEQWQQIIQSGEERSTEEKSRSVEAGKTPAVDTKSESGVDGEVKSEEAKSEEKGEEKSEEKTEDTLQPIGKGVFGNIYDQFKGKVKEAFDFLTKHKSGDLLGVFHRDGFGDIDLVWGDNGGGLAHIIQRHVEEQNDFNSVEEVRDVIDDVIKNGKIVRENADKVNIDYNGYRVSIRKNVRDGQGNVVENKNWVVTAFDRSTPKHEKRRTSSSETLSTPSANQEADGVTLPSNDNSSESKDTSNPSHTQANSGKTSENSSESEDAKSKAADKEKLDKLGKMGKAVDMKDLPKDMAYRETDVNELEDILESGQLRDIPEDKPIEGISDEGVTTRRGRTFNLSRPYGRSHGGKGFAKGGIWTDGGGTLAGGTATKVIIGFPGNVTQWREGFHNSYSDAKNFDDIEHGSGLWLPFDENGAVPSLPVKDMKVWVEGEDGKFHEFTLNKPLSEQISTASAEVDTNPTEAQKPNEESKKKEDSGASENGEGKEEVKPKKPTNEKGEESKADGEKGKGEKIEDVGEKIEGARKDALNKLAESMEQATEEALVAMPFSKAFKRPNLKKAVEDGVLREEDALFAQAVMSAYLSRKKPLMSKSRSSYESERSEKAIKIWAHHAYNGVEKLKKLFSLSPSERDTFMMEEMNRPAYDPKDVEKRKQDLMEWNPGKVFNGTCYPINAIRLWNDVYTQLGYEVGTDVPQLFSEVLHTTRYDSYVLVAANGTKFYPARSLNSYNAVVDEIVYQTKVANADADIDHPKETFKVIGSGEKKTKSSGKWYVVTQASLSAKPHKDIFSSKEEAEKFAKAYIKNDGKKVNKYRYASAPKEVKKFDGYSEYAVVLRRENIGKGTTTDFKLKHYNTADEARAAIDAEHDELNELANKELAKDKGSKSASTKKPICSIEVYAEDGKSWKYGIVLSDKYAPKKSALNTMPYYLAKDFNTRKEAQAYLDAHKEEIEAKAAKVDEARRNFKYFTANGERVGTDYRHGEDVSADQFREQFGFRGVQFGNWTNQRDRQEAINRAFDAFMDLSRLLGVSPRALSLNGELGVAFGARGSGKALAHYEPKEVVINLTKTSGAGSLAHEWWHALDNYFARQGNVAMGFVTQSKNIEMRDELRQAFNTLIDHLEKSPYNQRSKQRGSSYWGTPIEETARMFEQWVNDQLAERGEKSPFLTDADPYIEERYAQMNYEMYKFFMGDKAMPYEEYKQTPQALNGLVYLTRDELQTFGKDLKHIFDTIQQKVDETTGKTLMYHKGGVAVSLNSEEVALRDAVIDQLRENGIDVVSDVSEGQRVLDMANGKERLSGKQKRALETAEQSQRTTMATVVSSADGAKVLNNLDNLAKKLLEKESNRSKTFMGDVARAIGAKEKGSSSQYATFETKNGTVVTIRLANHNAKVSNFDNAGKENAISIVITRKPNKGMTNDGTAHIVEFFYPETALQRADGKPLSEIVRSIKQALYSGEFKDTTGIAERQEVNGDAEIVDKVKFFKTQGGEAYGFTVGGRIYIDPRIASSETAVHEYAHLWAEALRSANAKEWGNVVGLMRGTSVWSEVMERYPELKSDDEIADEVLATYSGRRGSERLRDEMERIKGSERSVADKARALGALERVKRALDRFWHGVADFLGIHYKSADEVADRVMRDLLNGVDPRRFVRGESDGRVREQFVGEDGVSDGRGDIPEDAKADLAIENFQQVYADYLEGTERLKEQSDKVSADDNIDAIQGEIKGLEDAYDEAYGELLNALEAMYMAAGVSKVDAKAAAIDRASLSRAEVEMRIIDKRFMKIRSHGAEVRPVKSKVRAIEADSKPKSAEYHSASGNTVSFEGMGGLRKLDKGEFAHVERVFTKSGAFSFSGASKIESIDDVAYIFRNLENYAVENTFAALVKDGVTHVVHLGMGGPVSSMADLSALRGAYDKFGADKIYFVHNHPSGTLRPSQQDVRLFDEIKQMFGSSVEIESLIIDTTSGKFSKIEDGDYRGSTNKKPIGEDVDYEVYAFDRKVYTDMFFDIEDTPRMSSSESVAGFISSHRLGNRKKVSYLVLSNQLKIMANIHTNFNGFDDVKGVVDEMVSKCIAYGGTQIVPYGNVDLSGIERVIRGVKISSGNTVGVIDALRIKNGLDYESYYDTHEEAAVYGTHSRTVGDNIAGKGEQGRSLRGDEALTALNRIFDGEVKDELPPTIPTIEKFRQIFSKPIRTFLGELIKVKDNVYNKIQKEKRTRVSGAVMPTIKNADFAMRDTDGSTLYIKRFNNNTSDSTYNIAVVNKHGEVEDYISSVHIKRDANLRNKIKNGAELLLPNKRNGDGNISRNNSTPDAKLGKISEKSDANGTLFRDEVDGVVSSSGVDGMRERAVELGRELGADVDVVSDVSEIVDANPAVQERKRRAKGWYDAKTGRVVINLAAHSDMADVEQTLLHEIVGHRGLRGLVGHENFNGFLDGVYEHASGAVREGIDDIARRKGCSKRVATEEYMSGLAEGGFADRKNAGLWQKIRQWFGDMLSRAKIKLKFSISDNELRYLLWRSHELSRKNGREGVVDHARDLAMQNRLGVGNVARKGGERVVDSYDGDLETLFRDADSPVDYERALIRDSYERRMKDVWFQSREALQDGMLSLKETMKDIWRSAGKKFSQITDIPDYANPYIGQNRLSSRNAAEVRDFKRRLFSPLLREVGRLTGFSADGRAKLTDYMMAKHGLERNKVMAERDAKHPNSLSCGP